MRTGSVILYKKGYCYQSYGWNLLRPLGRIQNVISHLDKYFIDDISIIRPVRDNDSSIDFLNDLNELRKLKSSSPISFGGGVRNIDQLNLLSGLPFERFIFSSILFNKDNKLLKAASKLYGRQAIVGLIPFKLCPELSVFNSQINEFVSLDKLNRNHLEFCDEIILYDCEREGFHSGFSEEIVDRIKLDPKSCVFSGGVTGVKKYLKNTSSSPKAVIIENSVLHREYSILNYYEKL
jgi:phosphoribosylformimino-5-aminoimidazole carboxamide ribonucleotide (ProFAR) isomerase